ncbi:MAG TPA: transposase [Tepidisphaeraceae bacterium]|nr:transposase [Tepidisphaeraceae bacterium]
MPRVARVSPGGMIFHCLNRGNDRRAVFDDSGDYAAFERVLEKTLELVPIRLLAYCLMPNHWHLVLWPRKDDRYFLVLSRYVERNALRTNLAANAQDWQWSSLWRRENGSPKERGILSEWPLPRPSNWVQWVNERQTDKELEAIRESLRRGRPFGEPGWQAATAARLGLESTFRERGRPKKA